MDLRLVSSASALCVASLVVAGCGGDGRGRPAAPKPDRLDLAVVGIEARIGDGQSRSSGIVVDTKRGLVVTTAHAVWGSRDVKISTALGVLHGRIVARAPCDDLALLQITPAIPGLATLPVAPAGAASPGQLLRSVGRRRASGDAAMASIPVRATGSPRSVRTSPLLRAHPVAIPLDSPLVPEVAGGPVLDSANRLVGMAITPGSAVPWARVRARLDDLKPGASTIYVGWADQYACAAGQQAYARATHPGYRAVSARLNAPVAATRLPGTEGIDG
jgi:S1-C subfamily serine protease